MADMTRKRANPPDETTHERVRVRRRAHWRTQRYGPDRALTKRLKIRALYVTVWRIRAPNYEFDFGNDPDRSRGKPE